MYAPPESIAVCFSLHPAMRCDEALAAVSAGGDILRERLARTGWANDQIVFSLNLAYEEVASNIARHALPNTDRAITVRCRILVRSGLAVMVILDNSGRFNPLASIPARVSLPASTIGGLGIVLLREEFSTMRYCRICGCNLLRFSKPIHREADGFS
ncbi:MAG: ATP-binding protein [Planctomycetaceae bacterium]|nr:ATP-binding protein [Planctomycetaceae bacterium]